MFFSPTRAVVLGTLLGFSILTPSLNAQQPIAAPFAERGLPFVQKHCLRCHGGNESKADLSLQADRDEAAVLKNRKKWEGVVRMVQSGEMPPAKKQHASACATWPRLLPA